MYERLSCFAGVCLAALVGLSNIACTTDLLLSGYARPELLDAYRYELGERYVEINDLTVCYQQHGEGETVLILPGLLTSCDFWKLNVPALAEHHRVYVLDYPGIGKADKPDVPYDLPWIRDQVIAFMDRMKIQDANLIGASLGGHLAMMIALEQPQRVRKLALMGSSGAWTRPSLPVTVALNSLWNEVLVCDHLRRHWPVIYGRMFETRPQPAEALFEYQMALRARCCTFWPEGRAATRILRSIFFHSVLDRLPALEQPTLLIWGEHDQWHLLSEALTLRMQLPNARLVLVPDSGHQVILEQPTIFNQLVVAFLDRGLPAIQDTPGW